MDPELSAAAALTLSAVIGNILLAPDTDPPAREHWIDPREDEIANAAGITPLGYYGWILYELPSRPIRIDIIREGPYYRLAETELPHAVTYARSWLYPRSGGLRQVIDAAMAWGGPAGCEPQGWAYRAGHRTIE